MKPIQNQNIEIRSQDTKIFRNRYTILSKFFFASSPLINIFKHNTTQTLVKLPLNKIKYIHSNITQMFVLVITHSFHLPKRISLLSATSYPPSTLAYPHLSQMLNSFLSVSACFFNFIHLHSAHHELSFPLCLQKRSLDFHHCHQYLPCWPVPPSLHLLCLFHFCRKMLLLLRPIYNNYPQFVN